VSERTLPGVERSRGTRPRLGRMARFVIPPQPRRPLPPSKLPLREQADLFDRLRQARARRPATTWKRLSEQEGFAPRTLEHFWKTAMELEENTDRRSAQQILVERLRGGPLPPPHSVAGVGHDDDDGAAPRASDEDARAESEVEPAPTAERGHELPDEPEIQRTLLAEIEARLEIHRYVIGEPNRVFGLSDLLRERGLLDDVLSVSQADKPYQLSDEPEDLFRRRAEDHARKGLLFELIEEPLLAFEIAAGKKPGD